MEKEEERVAEKSKEMEEKRREEKGGEARNEEAIPRRFMILQMKMEGRAPSLLSRRFLRTCVSVPEGGPSLVTGTRGETKRRGTNKRRPEIPFH